MDGNQIAVWVAKVDLFIVSNWWWIKLLIASTLAVIMILIGQVVGWFLCCLLDDIRALKKQIKENRKMELKVEISKGRNVKYVIDEANGIVTAYLSVDPDEAQRAFDKIYMNKACDAKGLLFNLTDFFDDKFCTKDEYRGVAKCHPDDVFDVEYGKKLALARAKTKHTHAMMQKFLEICQFIAGVDRGLVDKAKKIHERWVGNIVEECNLLKMKGVNQD